MTGDQIFGNRLAYVKSDPQRYDIVIFYYPDDEKQKFIKRVIGLPGETVTIRDGKVYINDSTEPLRDDFCPETPVGDFGPYEVPEGCYFMLGDNRNVSKDSRYWLNPYVEKDKIIGKAFLRYWPLNKISLLNKNRTKTRTGIMAWTSRGLLRINAGGNDQPHKRAVP